MRTVPFAVTHETWEEADAAGRYNRGLVVLFRDRTGNHRVPIGAGDSDDVEVFRDHGLTYVVSRNHGLGYVSLEVFEGDTWVSQTFLQFDEDIAEILGRDGLDRSGWWIARQLADCACV
jgi:hypothetical protein